MSAGCDMVTDWKVGPHDGEPGDEIECGAPIWLVSEVGGGYCREHADETAAEGLDNFTKADAERYEAQIAAERAATEEP